MTDFPDWQAPSAHAAQIATQGVPLLAGSVGVPGRTWTLAGGASSTAAAMTFHKIGYEMLVKSNIGGAATVPFAQLKLEWTDSGSGLLVATDTWVVPCCTSPSKWIVAGRGPTKADTCVPTVTNLDPAVTNSVELDVLENGRVYQLDDWGWINELDSSLTVPGFTLPSMVGDESCLGFLPGTTIAGSGSSKFLFGMWDGLITVGVEMISGTLSNLQVRMRPAPDSLYTGHNIFGSFGTPTTNFVVQGARAPTQVVVANSATTSIQVALGLFRTPR